MTDDEKAQAEAASWRAWQTAWGNTESGAHAHGWEDGYRVGLAAGKLSTRPELCRCGRPAFYSFDAPDPRCPGCEYMAAETCDCAPLPRPGIARVTVPEEEIGENSRGGAE